MSLTGHNLRRRMADAVKASEKTEVKAEVKAEDTFEVKSEVVINESVDSEDQKAKKTKKIKTEE